MQKQPAFSSSLRQFTQTCSPKFMEPARFADTTDCAGQTLFDSAAIRKAMRNMSNQITLRHKVKRFKIPQVCNHTTGQNEIREQCYCEKLHSS